jgi:hypothetical protein
MNDTDFLRAARRRWRSRLAEQRHACLMAAEADYAEAVSDYLSLLSSERRAPEMVALLERASPESYWKVFLTHWPNCDDTSALKGQLLSQLQRAASAATPIQHYSDEQRAFFESLPQVVTVYRGCSRQRIAGISWTTEAEIAIQFAHGHRQIPVPDPVIVTAEIDKNDILAVFTDRSENEIICTPSRILKIENFTDADGVLA